MNADDRKRFDELEARLNRRDAQIETLTEMMTGAVTAVAESLKGLAASNEHMAGLRTEMGRLNEGLQQQQQAVIKHGLQLRERTARTKQDFEEQLSAAAVQRQEG